MKKFEKQLPTLPAVSNGRAGNPVFVRLTGSYPQAKHPASNWFRWKPKKHAYNPLIIFGFQLPALPTPKGVNSCRYPLRGNAATT